MPQIKDFPTRTVATAGDLLIMQDPATGETFNIAKDDFLAGLSSDGGGITPLPADPYYANVRSLLHFNGTNGSTDFLDEKGFSVTRNGTPVIDTSISKYGGASGLFVSANNDYLSLPQVSIGTGDFTIESWVYPVTPFNDSFGICGQGNFFLSAFGGTLSLWRNGGPVHSFGANPATNAWTHIAVSRSSGVLKLFMNGSLLNSASSNSDFSTSENFNVGKAGSDAKHWNGYLDDFRITIGIGRYTDSFPIASNEFPNN